MFGVEHDQNEYLSELGRPKIKIHADETWTGVENLMQRVNLGNKTLVEIDEKTLFAPSKTETDKIPPEFTALIDESLATTQKLSESLHRTGVQLAALHTTKAHNHFCPLCTVAAANAKTGPLKDARDALKTLKSNKAVIVGNFSSAFERPEIKEAKDEMKDIVDWTYDYITQITTLYDRLALGEGHLERAAKGFWYGIISAMGPFLVLCTLYGILFCFGWCKYRKPKRSKPSPILTGLFFLTWSLLLLWATIFLLFSTSLLFVLGPLGEICVLSDELLIRGNYENYPWIAELLAPKINRDELETLNLLKGLGSLDGDGDLASLISIENVRSTLQNGANNALEVFKRGQKEGRKIMKQANVPQIRNTLLAGAWVVIPNVAEIQTSSPNLLVAFPEVLFSGLQLKSQPVGDMLKGITASDDDGDDGDDGDGPVYKNSAEKLAAFRKLKDKLTGVDTAKDDDIDSVIYGFEAAEKRINDELKKVFRNEKICFGQITTCHGTKPNTIIEADFDPTVNRYLSNKRASLGDDRYLQLLASVTIMTSKLRLLKEKPFVTIGSRNVETKVAYNAFVSTDPASNLYINKLIKDLGFGSIEALITRIGTAGADVSKAVESLLLNVPEFREGRARIIAEFIAFKDPLCRGLLKPLSAAVVMWCIVGILQIPLCVVGYRFWLYLKDVEINDSNWNRDRGGSVEDRERGSRRRRGDKPYRSEEDAYSPNYGNRIQYNSPIAQDPDQSFCRRSVNNPFSSATDFYSSNDVERCKFSSPKAKDRDPSSTGLPSELDSYASSEAGCYPHSKDVSYFENVGNPFSNRF